MSMIERVARAIVASDFNGDTTVFDTMSEEMKAHFYTNARAAIEAMREPTDFMVKAAREATPAGHLLLASAYTRDAIVAAINAALSDPDEGVAG